MRPFLAAWGATALAMLAIDMLWLGLIARPLYLQGIGHLMAAQPDLVAAAAFYLVYPTGLMLFAVLPPAGRPGRARAARQGALFGFFAYATYDLTNLATLTGWPLGLSLIDMAWGSLLSATAAAAGRHVHERLAPR